jgi:superfamily I DNA and/or RNA helicase
VTAVPGDHFGQLLALLQQERDEDLREYLQQVRERPLGERVERGYSWYPLQVLKTGFAIGEKAYIIVERTTRLDEPHQFRAGQSVSLFTQAPHVKQPDKQGVVHFVERNRMKIILNAREVPDWVAFGQLGVDQLFDDRSYQEMARALEKVRQAKGNRLAELRDLLTGKRPSAPLPPEAPVDDPQLNESQRIAVASVLAGRDVTILHGPPGTGKTTTLVAAIRRLVLQENCVLVSAPSNTAADLLTERLADAGLNVVRIGNVSRVDEHILPHTLDSIIAQHPETKNIKKVKVQAAEYRRQSRQHKRSFGHEERREREHLKQQAHELEAWANELEKRLVEQVLSGAQAITCTLVGAAHPVLEGLKFRTCVIDEAAQALEPATWIPILASSRVVLAGDPYQLPPTVKSLEAARNGLSRTLIERGLVLLPQQVQLLNVQYRMHQAIMDFSNQWFYQGALLAHESVERRGLALPDDAAAATDEAPQWAGPLVFIDTAGTGFEEKTNRTVARDSARRASKYNPEEGLLLREHLLRLLRHFPYPDQAPSIGVLSPYREQVLFLEELFRDDALLAPMLDPTLLKAGKGLIVNTIDGFQGQERDVVYLSMVRSNPKHDIGFLADYRRMNVAMTRARKLLVLLGDSATIGKNPFYEKLLEYCAEKGAYQTAWAYMG